MKNSVVVIAFLLIFVFMFGCTKTQKVSQDASNGATYSECEYYQKVGTYEGSANQVAKDVALEILKKRDSRITLDDLKLNLMPYVDASTNPPSSAKGPITYTIFDRNAPNNIEKSRTFESSEIVEVSISTEFYNKYFSDLDTERNDCEPAQSASKDSTCIGKLYFAKQEVYLAFNNPC